MKSPDDSLKLQQNSIMTTKNEIFDGQEYRSYIDKLANKRKIDKNNTIIDEIVPLAINFENVIDKIQLPIWIVKADVTGVYTFLKVNNAYAIFKNSKISSFTGKNIEEFYSASEIKEFKKALHNAKIKGSSEYVLKVKINKAEKQYLCKINLIPESRKSSYCVCSLAEVTALYAMVEELKKEKTLHHTYLDIAGVMIIVLDKNGKVKLVNKKGSEILGYKSSEIVGRNWFNNFIPKENTTSIKQRFSKLVHGKEPDNYYENEILTKDLQSKLIFWHTSKLFNETGEFNGIISSGEDVTEHKRMQEELQQQSRNADYMYKLSKIIANSEDLDVLLDKTAQLLSTYPGILTGSIAIYESRKTNNFSKSIYFGKRIKAVDYIFERSTSSYIKSFTSGAYEDISNLSYSVYGKNKQGQSYSIGMFSQKEPQGLLNVICSNIDRTNLKFYEHAALELSRGIKKKKVEIQQQLSEKKFSAIFNTAPDCMVITSLENSVMLEVNQGFTDMTGFKRNEVIGRSVFEINSWASPKERLKLTLQLKKEKKVSGFLTKLIRKDGTIFDALFSAAFIDYNGKKCMLTIAKDVSERVKIEKENLETKELLERITATTPGYISLYNVKKDIILFNNKSLLLQLGYDEKKINTIKKLSPDDRYSFYHNNDVDTIKDMDQMVLQIKTGEILKKEYRIKNAKGNFIWFQHSITVFQEETKHSPLLTINVLEDITERKNTEEQFKKYNEEIEFLYQTGKLLAGTLDIYKIFDRMHGLASKIADIKELIVTSFDPENNLIHYEYLRSSETNKRVDVTNIPPIPLAPEGFGIVSKVIRSGKSMLFDNYTDSFSQAKTTYVINEKGNLSNGKQMSRVPKSAMFIPIKLKEKILGVAQFYSKQIGAFNLEQVRLLELMMNQVALAMHNANLYEEAQKEISERKKAEENLRESKEDLIKFAESVPDVIYSLNYLTGKYEFISPVIVKLLGYPLEDIHNGSYDFIKKTIHPEDLENVTQILKEYLDSGPVDLPVQIEYRMIKKDGSVLWIRDIIKFEWKDNKPIASIGAMSDITINRKMEVERRKRDELIILQQSALLELSRLKNTDLDETLKSITEITSKALKIDKVSVWLFQKDGNLYLKDSYLLGSKKHNSNDVLYNKDHSNFFELLYTDKKYLNEHGGNEEFMSRYIKEWLVPFGTSLIIISRVRLHGDVVGIIVMESLDKEKLQWTPEEYDFSVSVAGFVTLALESQEHTEAELKIKKSLNEKEMLLREIHHRVKNNLQVISSLLYLQSKKSSDNMVIDALLESQRRVKSMVLIHEKLYRSEDLASIDYKHYITDLTNSLFRSYRLDMSRISLETDIDEIKLNTDSAIQCGLIINELVSNAIKHAFPGERKGVIRIGFKNDSNNTFKLQVSDNGVGIHKNYCVDNSDTLGMQLVNTLVAQMNGTLEIKNTTGSTFTINFSVKK